MIRDVEKCAHLRGFQITSAMEYRCPDCEKVLDTDGIDRWVREAERARDETYLMVEGDGFTEIAREESQQEVYRRRKVLYELRDIPRAAARPEMVLIVYDGNKDCYECRIFYKEPKPVWCMERLSIEASEGVIRELKDHSDPVARVLAEKILEFHEDYRNAARSGQSASTRRVFYANEL